MKKTIALCMIVKDEEKYLKQCLESARIFVDQIVIVDTGSTDRTVEIAQQYEAEIYHFDWINDFAAARNESIKYARTDYILVLDADEYLSEGADLQADVSSGNDYYFMKVHNVLSGNRAIDHLAIRLFVNHKELHYQHRLHEHLNTMDYEELVAGYAQTRIMHVGYTDEMMEERNKAERNLPLMLQEVKENPNAYNLFNMGRTYMWIGEHEKAINYLKKAYPVSKELIIVPELVSTLCKSLSELNRDEEAMLILRDAVNVYPCEVDLLYLKALVFEKMNYKKDAILTMEACLELGDQGITVSEGNGSYIAHFMLAEWYEDIGQVEKSYTHIEQALKIKNDFTTGLYRYIQTLNKVGVPEKDAYHTIRKLYPFSGIKRLKDVIEVLYALRSPLLLRCLSEYQINVDDYVQATAFQYAKQYVQAESAWISAKNLPESTGQDILVLAILQENIELAKLALSKFNLNKNEQKFILNLFGSNAKKEFQFTMSLEKIFEFVIMQLIQLQEFEHFEKILNMIWDESNQLKLHICKHLMENGFTDVAIDLLLVEYKKIASNNFDLIKQLAYACEKQGYYDDAKSLYAILIEKRSDYQDYEALYNVYNKSGDAKNAEIIKEYLRSAYPLSEWTKK